MYLCEQCGRRTVGFLSCPRCHQLVCYRCLKVGGMYLCPTDYSTLPSADQRALQIVAQRQMRMAACILPFLIPIFIGDITCIIMQFVLMNGTYSPMNEVWGEWLWGFLLSGIPFIMVVIYIGLRN